MSLKVYINGQYFDKEDAKISVYDHGLLYGDGVFEGMRSYGGVVFRLDERSPDFEVHDIIVFEYATKRQTSFFEEQ